MAWCDRCERGFPHDRAFEQHRRDSSFHWLCYKCDRDFTSERSRIQHYTQSPRHHYCQRCDEIFDDDEDLEQHFEEAHWYCSPCSLICDSQRQLRAHKAESHWWCSICDRIFQNENNLTQHKRTHEPKNIHCPGRGCTRAVSRVGDLVLHFESGTCPSGITRADVERGIVKLDRNGVITDTRRLIQGPDGVLAPRAQPRTWATAASWNGAAYECVLCHRTFPQLHALNAHLQSPAHADKIFKCPSAYDGCDQRFPAASALVQHIENGSCGVRKFQRTIERYVEDLTSGMRRLGMS
ncbi:C2H2 type zinc-finger protein [Phanerochaete sordida]|uniref:C2H2 type zinc-finger protein n=1 Tax=Phanerochaete sordida TaxID=48140 RepID=A0A9P3GMK4_9APHY|nr:C2H2 type zinc-finger protein [Phanerochaete sordida]